MYMYIMIYIYIYIHIYIYIYISILQNHTVPLYTDPPYDSPRIGRALTSTASCAPAMSS